MNRRRFFSLLAPIAAVMLCGSYAATAAEPLPTGFLDRTVSEGDVSIPYLLYVPRNYTPEKKWPVVLFLHGSGERGTDGLKQSQVGIGQAIRMNSDRFPALVVMPQCAPGKQWTSPEMTALALKALDRTLADYSTDPDRQYLTGLSMGGYGSWRIATDHPDRFAAVLPICGGGDPKGAEKLKSLPIWVFHGGADPTVPVQRSRDMVQAIKDAGSTTIQFTELDGVGHNSWDAAYANKMAMEWLFSQHRNK
jgi:predicted peptidase